MSAGIREAFRAAEMAVMAEKAGQRGLDSVIK